MYEIDVDRTINNILYNAQSEIDDIYNDARINIEGVLERRVSSDEFFNILNQYKLNH